MTVMVVVVEEEEDAPHSPLSSYIRRRQRQWRPDLAPALMPSESAVHISHTQAPSSELVSIALTLFNCDIRVVPAAESMFLAGKSRTRMYQKRWETFEHLCWRGRIEPNPD
jgi:hypothetical protein